jgi:hypothetical protein
LPLEVEVYQHQVQYFRLGSSLDLPERTRTRIYSIVVA